MKPKQKKAAWIRYIKRRIRDNKNFLAICSGRTGCLSKDTIIYGQNKTLEELYKSGNNFIDTYSLTKAKNVNGTFYPIKSKSEIISSGIKEVYEIELDNGKKVLATLEHKFFRENKNHSYDEVQLIDLKEGDKLRDFSIEYIINFFDKANNRQKNKTRKNFNHQRICTRCNNIYYIECNSGKTSRRYCDSCMEQLTTTYKTKKIKNDVWHEWEDNILRQFYFNKEKKFILELLPNRTWESIYHRTNKININRDKKFKYENSAFTKENNPMNNKDIRKKSSDSHKKLYLEHPEKLLNARLKRNQMTNIEKKMSEYLDSMGINYEWNKYVKTINTFRFPDFRINNLIIECDGLYWHNQSKEKDDKRQKELEAIGFKVIRFNDKEIINNFEEVKRCIQQELNQ